MIRTNSHRGDYYKRYLTHYARKNYILLLLAALFISGVAIGAMLIRSAGSDTLNMLLSVVNGFVETRREQSLVENLISTASSSLIFIAVLFICGFCAISQPLILFIPFLRGLGFGFSAASLYASHGISAFGFVSLLIVPDMLISSFAILLCGRESLRFAGNFKGVLWNTGNNDLYPLRIYFGRYIAAAILCVVSAFIESVLYFSFANFFVLG